MYPFEALRGAWEQLWASVHGRVPWTPDAIRWAGDVHDHWIDPLCTIAHVCGWPVATSLRSKVAVVGAFSLALADADRHRYRSVILATRACALDELIDLEVIAAANSADSLSGYVSLRAAIVLEATRRNRILWTGAHVDSLRALQDGSATLACIDELSMAHIRRFSPDLADGLSVIGRGPWIPSPPIVVPISTPAARITELREAFAVAMADPATGALRR